MIAGLILIQAGVVDTSNDSSSAPLIAPAALAKPASTSSHGLTVHDIYQRDASGVAFIRSQIVQKTQSVFGFPQQQQSTATGSGFLIDNDGHILTNAHVVDGAKNVTVQLGNGAQQSAQVVGSDPSTDVALLKVDNTEGAQPLPLGDSTKVQVGDPVVAIGNPFALDRTVTSGIVSALQRQIQAPNGFSISDVIQTDAAINPGNSGGPLINGAGQVIGINSQIESQSGGNVGIGFAVPIKTAADVASQLENGGQVHQAYLGISGGDIDPQIAHALNLPVNQGVLIERVLSGGPADDAGIKGATGQATIARPDLPGWRRHHHQGRRQDDRRHGRRRLGGQRAPARRHDHPHDLQRRAAEGRLGQARRPPGSRPGLELQHAALAATRPLTSGAQAEGRSDL